MYSDGSRGQAQGGWLPHPPLFWVEKEEMTEGRKASWASKIELGLKVWIPNCPITESETCRKK